MTTTSHITVAGANADLPGTANVAGGLLRRLSVSWEAVANFVVPIGYEDEEGFHYGTPVVVLEPAGLQCASREAIA